MNEAGLLALALLTGALLGAMFFFGLWWTVSKLVSGRTAVVLLPFGFLIRMALVLLGFYLVSGGHWQRLTACLVGFFVARTLSTRLGAMPDGTRSGLAKGAGYAP